MSIRQGNNILAGKSTYRPSLFDFKWADHALTDASWLSADTFEWHDGNDYSVAMNHLINDLQATSSQIQLYAWDNGIDIVYTRSGTPLAGDYLYTSGNQIIQREGCSNTIDSITSPTEFVVATWNSELNISFTRDSSSDVVATNWNIAVTPFTETIGATTIMYYVALDGHKLILPDQIDEATAIYNNTGIAWYYIVDLYNNQFKLPRSKHNVVGLRNVVGKYVQPGLPDHTHAIKFRRNDSTGHHANGNITPHIYTPEYTYQGDTNAAKNASENNPIYGSSDTVQSPATEAYLYFYVGNFPELNQDNILDLVHKSGNETITGIKTFNNDIYLNGYTRHTSNVSINNTFPVITLRNTSLNTTEVVSGSNYTTGANYTSGNGKELGYSRHNLFSDSGQNYSQMEFIAIDPDPNKTNNDGTRKNTALYLKTNGTTQTAALNFSPGSTNATANNQIATLGWVNNPSLSTNVVHRSGTETIAGTKTFNNDMNVNAKLKVTGGITGRFRTAEAWQDDDKSAKWFNLGNFDSKSTYHTQTVVFKLQATSSSDLRQGLATGKIVTRTGGSGSGSEGTCSYAKIIFDNPIPRWLDTSNVALIYKENLTDSSNNKYVNFQLWIKSVAAWESYVFIIENEQTSHNYSTDWTFYIKKSSAGQCQDGLPGSGSGYTQAFSVISNTNRNASGDGIYDWMGTLAQYNAQNIATTHPEWLCFITDDHTATAYSAYSKTESDSRYVKTADIDTRFSNLLKSLYPVGSIYIGTQSSCPLQTLISGSTWTLVGQDRALWGGNGANGNTTIEAGLPNVTGNIHIAADLRDTPTGAFSTSTTGIDGATNNNNDGANVNFDASKSNSIYGNSTTVQPKAYRANIWRRTA